MLCFKPLTLQDYEVVSHYLAYEKALICDTMPGTIFMWRDYFHTEFCIDAETLYFRITYPDGMVAYSVPCGKDFAQANLDKLAEYVKEQGAPLVFSPVTPEQISLLEEHFTIQESRPVRDWYDYIYNVTGMQTFSGKKLHGQRNFLNRFNKLYPEARVEAISAENLDLCKKFLKEYSTDALSSSATAEISSVREVLDHYDRYGLLGTCILVNDVVVAFAIGSQRENMLFEHIEKASRDYPGAYQKIASEFAKMYGTGKIEFVNREDDMGNLSLRTSKLAYKPVLLSEKYIIYVSEVKQNS